MVVSYLEFGLEDRELYRFYLEVCSSYVPCTKFGVARCSFEEHFGAGVTSGVGMGGRVLGELASKGGGTRGGGCGQCPGSVDYSVVGGFAEAGVADDAGRREASCLVAKEVGVDSPGSCAVDRVGVGESGVCGELSAGVVGDDSVSSVAGAFVAGSSVGVQGRGPNYERNRANALAQKARKKKRKEMQNDWRNKRGVDLSGKSSVSKWCGTSDSSSLDEKGFWNSCSGDVRQQLIDSKARMHIAENERREKKAKDELAEMESPIAMVQKVLKLVKLTEESAKRANDNQVAGWAKTVAQSHSESVAKSAPSTMQSFESFVDSSASSVPVEIHDEVLKKWQEEQDVTRQLKIKWQEEQDVARQLKVRIQQLEEIERQAKKPIVKSVVGAVKPVVGSACVGKPVTSEKELWAQFMTDTYAIEARYKFKPDAFMMKREKDMLRKQSRYVSLFS